LNLDEDLPMATKMFYGAGRLIFERAKDLRNRMTDAETVLWGYLKQKPLGYKFRRQHPLGFYIADFYCHKLLLVIEVDGKIHGREDVAKNDKERQHAIESLGLKVVRFTNDEVHKQLEKVVSTIEEFINNHRSL
jgi:imidazole glycerol-phosphate synthase subunit HisF